MQQNGDSCDRVQTRSQTARELLVDASGPFLLPSGSSPSLTGLSSNPILSDNPMSHSSSRSPHSPQAVSDQPPITSQSFVTTHPTYGPPITSQGPYFQPHASPFGSQPPFSHHQQAIYPNPGPFPTFPSIVSTNSVQHLSPYQYPGHHTSSGVIPANPAPHPGHNPQYSSQFPPVAPAYPSQMQSSMAPSAQTQPYHNSSSSKGIRVTVKPPVLRDICFIQEHLTEFEIFSSNAQLSGREMISLHWRFAGVHCRCFGSCVTTWLLWHAGRRRLLRKGSTETYRSGRRLRKAVLSTDVGLHLRCTAQL